VITLVCVRLGHPELQRALAATVGVVTAELHRSRPELALRLAPMLDELVNTAPGKSC